MRQYARHNTTIPIQVSIAESETDTPKPLINLCVGGLCCEAGRAIAVGTIIDIQIPGTSPLYQGKGIVVWCDRIEDGRYELGVHFKQEDQVFRAKMVEQVCQIERYKTLIRQTEGRHLSSEDAAREWIKKFAGNFKKSTPHQ